MPGLTDRQKDIVEASLRIIAEHGTGALTIKNLAAQLGVSEPALYRHFPGKKDILLGILAYFEDSSRELFEEIRSSGASSLVKLENIFQMHCRRFSRRPELSSVLFSEDLFQNDPRLAEKMHAIMTMTGALLNDILRRGIADGEIRSDLPAGHLSLLFMGTLRLLVLRWRLSGFDFDLEQEGMLLWESLERLLHRLPVQCGQENSG
jgi:AcrR family transcriptional regulator